jgi:hypothetical protein
VVELEVVGLENVLIVVIVIILWITIGFTRHTIKVSQSSFFSRGFSIPIWTTS